MPIEEREDTTAALADPGARLLGRVVDLGAPFIPAFLLVPIGVAAASSSLIRAGFLLTILAAACLTVLNLIWLYRSGQTLGKRIAGVRIVRRDGTRAGLARILVLRGLVSVLVGLIPWIGALYGLVDALCVFTAQRRCVHDLIADTIVIDARCERRQ